MSTSSLYSSSSSLNTISKASSNVTVLFVWTIIAIIAAIAGGIALYFTFLSKKNDGKFNGFLGWIYDTFSFKKMLVETLLKITYLIGAIFITLYSFGLIAVNILAAFGCLIFGNLLLRICYEFMLMNVIICRNTTDINSKFNKVISDKKDEQ
jgi:hypothetical protein